MRKPISGSDHAQRGQAMVEFALVFPLLLLVLVGIFDLGLAVWQYGTVSNVARESTRWAVARGNQPWSEADFLDDASNPKSNAAAVAAGSRQAQGLDSSRLQISIYPNNWESRSTWGLVISATATYTYTPITGLVPQGGIVLRATSVMITE